MHDTGHLATPGPEASMRRWAAGAWGRPPTAGLLVLKSRLPLRTGSLLASPPLALEPAPLPGSTRLP